MANDRAVNNKLHAIQPSLGRWPGSRRNARREEVVLARIRLGHAYLTHSYLLNREDQPECVGMCLPIDSSTYHDRWIRLYTKQFFRCQKHERSLRFLQQSYCTLELLDFFPRCDLTSYLGLCTHVTITLFLVDSVQTHRAVYTCFGTVWPFWCWCAVKLWYHSHLCKEIFVQALRWTWNMHEHCD